MGMGVLAVWRYWQGMGSGQRATEWWTCSGKTKASTSGSWFGGAAIRWNCSGAACASTSILIIRLCQCGVYDVWQCTKSYVFCVGGNGQSRKWVTLRRTDCVLSYTTIDIASQRSGCSTDGCPTRRRAMHSTCECRWCCMVW